MKILKRSALVFSLLGILCLEPLPALAREMEEYPRIKLRSLEKTTARTMTFEARVGTTLKFGPLFIKILSCQKSSPMETPESAAFLQIWEVPHEKKQNGNSEQSKPRWVFSGWMFASSPALSPMDHPIYDVWVIECLQDENAKPVTPAITGSEGSGISKENPELGKETSPDNEQKPALAGIPEQNNQTPLPSTDQTSDVQNSEDTSETSNDIQNVLDKVLDDGGDDGNNDSELQQSPFPEE